MGRTGSDTKARLIETATRMIWASSYNAVSVDDICKEADVKKGSFYHYFPSKAHLALESMQSGIEQFREKYNDMFSVTRPPLERFEMMVSFIIDQQKEVSAEIGHACGCPFITLGTEMAAQAPEIAETITSVCGEKATYYESALRDLVNEGLIPQDTDVTLKAQEIYSFIIGQLILARINNDLVSFEKHMKKGLFDLIGVRPAGKSKE